MRHFPRTSEFDIYLVYNLKLLLVRERFPKQVTVALFFQQL